MIKYLNGTKKNYLLVSDDYKKVITWYMDASFSFHHDFNSHTRAIITMVQGAVHPFSRKQKLNRRIIIEAGLVAVDDTSV